MKRCMNVLEHASILINEHQQQRIEYISEQLPKSEKMPTYF